MKKYLPKIGLTRPRPTVIPTPPTYKILHTACRDLSEETKPFWWVKTLHGRMELMRGEFITI